MSVNREIAPQTTELFRASEAGDVDRVAELLKDPVVDINWHCTQSYGATPVIAAIANGHASVVEMLLDAGVELGATKTPDRNSPLHEAAFRDEPAMMRGILSKIQENSKYSLAALVDLQNQFGNTPLHIAARTGSASCVTTLLDAKASIKLKNANGSLPLHHACYCEKPNAPVVELLVAAGSDVNAVDDQGYTALIVAAKKEQTEIVSSLLAHGADRSIKNMFGEDALHYARAKQNAEAMRMLQPMDEQSE